MCGIIGAFHTGPKKEPVNEIALEQFEDQQDRGVKGFGIVKIQDDMAYKIERATEGYKFMWDIHHDPVKAMIVHHRQPTSSDNKIAQTHPIVVDNGSLKFKYLLVHNGICHNDEEIKLEHEKLGFVYTTVDKAGAVDKFNDSECVAIEVARFIEKQVDVIGTKGSAAFMCLQIDKKTDKITKLFFGRNDTNPLKMAKTRNVMIISSAGKGCDVEPMYLYECELDDKMKLNKRKMSFAIEPPITTSYTVDGPRTIPARSGYRSRSWRGIGYGYEDDDEYGGYGDKFKRVSGYNSDVPAEEDDPMVEIVEDTDETIKTSLESFYDMLYDPTTAETIGEVDIEMIADEVKRELTDLAKSIQDKYQEIALEKETAKGAV
jgi:predicted glutamine amidotransferase